MTGDPELVVLAAVPDGVTASIMASALESAGIPVEVRGAQAGGWLFPGARGGLGAATVLVPSALIGEAREILEALDAGSDEGSDRNKGAGIDESAGAADSKGAP